MFWVILLLSEFNNNLTICWLNIAGYGTCGKGSYKICTYQLPVAYITTYCAGAALSLGGENYGHVLRHYVYRYSTGYCALYANTDNNYSFALSGITGTVITIGY